MGIIIDIDDGVERMQRARRSPSVASTSSSTSLRTCICEKPNYIHMEEEEQPPLICAFFAGLEEAMNVGPYALAQHLSHNGHDIFTKLR